MSARSASILSESSSGQELLPREGEERSEHSHKTDSFIIRRKF